MDKFSERNVFEMIDYRADAGFCALSQVEAYWEALRGSRLMPKRSEIDPRGIKNALEYTFVLERIAIGMARVRIGGSHLNNLMGMEVRGMPITSFITPTGRGQMGEMLEEVFQRPSACEVRLTSEIGRQKLTMDARMLLLPLKSDLGDVSRILGCFVARGDMGDQPRRFDIVGTKIRPLEANTDGIDAPNPPKIVEQHGAIDGFHDPQASYAAEPTRGHKPYLRLVKNDD